MCSIFISKETQDKVKLAKKYIEDKYQALITKQKQQKQNWKKIVDLMTQNQIPASEKQTMQKELKIQQDIKKRLMRQKDCLKNYELYNLIGKGAFGEVRLARNRKTNEIVAIKRMQKLKLVQKKQISSAYMQKQLMIKNGDSKFLVKLYSTFQDRKYVYLVMEYVSGGDLLHLLIKEDIFSEEDTKFYIAELILALEEIHSKNFIHRDIKPDNILIDVTGHIKISDFGLSKFMAQDANKKTSFQFERCSVNSKRSARQTHQPTRKYHQKLTKIGLAQERAVRTFSKVGTPDYISPEVLTCEEYDYSIDIWSVGVIMFECLFGYPPFSDEDPKQVCQKVVDWIEYLEFPNQIDISIEAKLLILGMINERQKRLSIKQIKDHPFFFDIDWNNLSKLKPPMIPDLEHELDTKNFEKIDDEQDWVDQDQLDQKQPNKQHLEIKFEAYKSNSLMKKRSSSADYLFAGFEYKNVPIEPFKFIENKISMYQHKREQKMESSKKFQQPKSLQFAKKSVKKLHTESLTKEKDSSKILQRKSVSKYILKMPKSSKNVMQKLNQTTSSMLQFTRTPSKIVNSVSFMKEKGKNQILRSTKLTSVKKIGGSGKTSSKKII